MSGKALGKLPGFDRAHQTGQRAQDVRVERVRNGLEAMLLVVVDRDLDLVSEIDGVHAFIARLDASLLAANEDLEPDAADAGRLNGQRAGLA